jgi:hypothetical protein
MTRVRVRVCVCVPVRSCVCVRACVCGMPTRVLQNFVIWRVCSAAPLARLRCVVGYNSTGCYDIIRPSALALALVLCDFICQAPNTARRRVAECAQTCIQAFVSSRVASGAFVLCAGGAHVTCRR